MFIIILNIISILLLNLVILSLNIYLYTSTKIKNKTIKNMYNIIFSIMIILSFFFNKLSIITLVSYIINYNNIKYFKELRHFNNI
jgi:hypothetical protein